MSVCTVKNNYINLGFNKCCHSVKYICCNTDTGTAEQSALFILCCKRIFDRLFNILNCNKTFQIKIVIHDRKLFFSCLCQNCLCFFQCNAFLCCNQSLGSHGLFDLFTEICFKFQITVCNDTDKFTAFRDRNTGNTEFSH